ncbi:valine--tRNA ligase [Roseinatronobacter bogoriensis]|uniref:Valine--tRNA ligase n=1 Tax=Roseinatronobacter bogoriensis subsp. barguzinensis TaxID=441209 RepID=A0A2K8KEF4_9RHOB|nr:MULTISPECIES: valine--tRNA ligase [Rhodobaca]ATX67827.1 valine--tRNA ligase [Rhodobaca barguzinensis]
MAMDKNFDAKTAEPRIAAKWSEAGAFRAGANKSRDESFCIMIPPPNVTGSLHMGHAFNNTLQDILVRWHRMRGFDTLWQPGQDHAGIATQMVVERGLAAEGKKRTDFTREEFLAKVWDWKAQSGGTIINQLKRLGASCDWDRNAFTMSGAPGAPEGEEGNFHDAVIKVFVDMYNKELIYRGKRLVNWDPHFETAISDLEVENIETDGHMWHFKYPLADGVTYRYIEKDEEGAVIVDEMRDYISIATTRPETMLGDGAVAVHPSDERYAPIVGKLCEIPVGPKEHRRLIPIITDDYPDPEFGSGAVKITGAHDANDYGVAKRGGIPMYRLMDTRAQMRADGAPYAEAAAIAGAVARGAQVLSEAEADALNLVPDHLRGLDRYAARKAVVEEITSEGLAVMTRADDPRLGRTPGEEDDPAAEVPLVEAKKIMQPFGDRSKVVIEPMLTDQWFVDAGKVVGPALDAVRSGRVKIMPESGEKTYYHWLENIEPWCISRQLWWGHQIPVWYGPGLKEDGSLDITTTKFFCAASLDDAISEASNYYKKHSGKLVQVFALEQGAKPTLSPKDVREIKELHDKPFVEPVRDGEKWQIVGDAESISIKIGRDPDVLDTWFSSGLWPIGTLGWPEQTEELQKYFPTSVLVTGQDILFFWVARMMMMQLAVVDQVPFHHVYLHGLVRDAKGKKMSKSLGNVVDPLEIIDEYGADALRFTNAAMASLGGVLKLDTQRIAGYRNFTTKLWNACRFAEMNGVWEDHSTQAMPPEAKATVNRWIIGETARVRETVDAALAEYRFNDAAQALYAFVWGRVCDWYVEFAKPLFDGEDAAETRATMGWVLDQCMILLHPMMPFITEELWGLTGQRDKLCAHADWPEYGADLVDADAMREMRWVLSLIEGIRSARAQLRVRVGLKLNMVQLDLDAQGRAALSRNMALVMRLARIAALEEVEHLPKGSITVTVEGGTFGLPLEGVIDIAAERDRLEKTCAKLEKEMSGIEGRLRNPKFVASAPDEVVTEARERAQVLGEEVERVRAAIAQLDKVS